MSLIGEALKEANRERAAQSTRSTKPLSQIVIPAPRAHSRRREHIVSAAGIVLATGTSVLVGAMFWVGTHRTAATAPVFEHLPSAPIVNLSGGLVAPSLQTPTTVAPPPAQRNAAAPVGPAAHSTPTHSASTHAATVAPPPPRDSATPARTAKAVAPSSSIATGIVQEGSPSATTPPAGPRAADSLFKLAYAAHLRGDFDSAAGLYERTLATQSAPSNAYNDYGVLLKRRDDPDAATKMFRQAIAHDDTNVDAWVNLGDMLDGAGEHGEALSAFARASQLDPSRIAVKTRLAAQYQAIGDLTTARQFFEDAVRLDPNEPGAHYALGLFLQSQRELPGAIHEYQRFVDLAPDKFASSAIADVKQHIVALRKLTP